MRAAAQVDLMIYATGKETFRRRYGPAADYLAVLLPFFLDLGPTEARKTRTTALMPATEALPRGRKPSNF